MKSTSSTSLDLTVLEIEVGMTLFPKLWPEIKYEKQKFLATPSESANRIQHVDAASFFNSYAWLDELLPGYKTYPGFSVVPSVIV